MERIRIPSNTMHRRCGPPDSWASTRVPLRLESASSQQNSQQQPQMVVARRRLNQGSVRTDRPISPGLALLLVDQLGHRRAMDHLARATPCLVVQNSPKRLHLDPGACAPGWSDRYRPSVSIHVVRQSIYRLRVNDRVTAFGFVVVSEPEGRALRLGARLVLDSVHRLTGGQTRCQFAPSSGTPARSRSPQSRSTGRSRKVSERR